MLITEEWKYDSAIKYKKEMAKIVSLMRKNDLLLSNRILEEIYEEIKIKRWSPKCVGWWLIIITDHDITYNCRSIFIVNFDDLLILKFLLSVTIISYVFFFVMHVDSYFFLFGKKLRLIFCPIVLLAMRGWTFSWVCSCLDFDFLN